MNDHDDYPDEPPPSYQEATGNPSITHRPESSQPPPPLPPRQPGKQHPPPPAQAQHPPASSSSASSPATNPPPQTFGQLLPHINRQFPPAVNLYRDNPFPGAAPVQRRLFLGEHQFPALYAVGVFPSRVVLHNGPSDDFPPLATVAIADSQGRRMHVSLPPLTPAAAAAAAAPTPVAFTLARTNVFTLRIEVPSFVGGAGGFRFEAFEWRRSSSSRAIGVLGGAAVGWELVRLANELPAGGAAAGGAGTGPPSGDGHEVVAACTSAVMSMTKLWKFCFLGTGVSGALGERWAVMAVVTGLVLWDRDVRWMVR